MMWTIIMSSMVTMVCISHIYMIIIVVVKIFNAALDRKDWIMMVCIIIRSDGGGIMRIRCTSSCTGSDVIMNHGNMMMVMVMESIITITITAVVVFNINQVENKRLSWLVN